MGIDISLDLETMSKRPTAAIVEIGAVAFDHATGEIVSEFQTFVDLNSCLDAGLHVDGDTIAWWMTADEPARRRIAESQRDNDGMPNNPPLECALRLFELWLKDVVQNYGEYRYFWAAPSHFDIPILANAFYAALGRGEPWDWRRVADGKTFYRTSDLGSMSKVTALFRAADTHHAADVDARAQALAIVDGFQQKALRGK